MRLKDQRLALLVAIFGCWSNPSISQQAVTSLEEIRVFGDRLDYSLADSPSPTLIYGSGHFQSFEPQAVGDMLKRISGVAFSGDIGEFDAPQLRGLGPQYTQILIDGKRIPGNSGDRTVLVDRIPAELIERIELVRSPTPDMDSQGIGGTLNLVLKDGENLQGTDWRLGSLYYPQTDPAFRGAASITHGAKSASGGYLIAVNTQERLNPKSKLESVYENDGNPLRITRIDDLRDNTDNAIRGAYSHNLGDLGSFGLTMAFLDNDIDENEFIEILEQDAQLAGNAFEERRIEQVRMEISARLDHKLADNMDLQLNFSGARFDDDSNERESLLTQATEQLQLQQLTRTEGQALQLNGALSWQPVDAHVIESGAGLSREYRDLHQVLLEFDDGEVMDSTPGNGFFRVQETRIHAYLMDTWNISRTISLDFGVRLENTNLSQRGNDGKASESQVEFNPSAHLLYRVSDFGQFRVGIAKTLRRPGFDEIVPFTNRDTPDEDQVTVGNPQLQPEIAWGMDVGYSHRFTNYQGNLGINLFYRTIDNKIELTQTGENLYTPRNIGAGRTWGMELDFAFPFSFIELPEVSLSGNYVWIDSKINDPFTDQTRQFNLQPKYIANLDFYHDIPALGLSHGLSWQTQGGVQEYQTDEIKTVRYGSNLEYFVEKQLGENLTLRLSANNILDSRKREHSLLYQGLADRSAGLVEEAVFEREQSGPVFFLTIRGSF